MKKFKFMAKISGAFSLFIFALVIFAANTFAVNDINIKIAERTEIENDRILLGNIAAITGNNPELIQMIKNIVLGPAPPAGEQKKFNKGYILIHLKQNGISPSKVNIIIPKSAVVTRHSIEIPQKDIEKIVLNFLNKKLPWDVKSVKITDIRVNSKVILPKGNITYQVIPPKNTDYLGNILISVSFSVNGQFKKQVWVSTNIEAFAKVVVTRRPLGRYKLITEDDIHLVKMNLAKLPSGVITSCNDVLGKRTKRFISSNVALGPDLVELPPLVKRGDIVVIVAESEGLKVTALGKVKERGKKGQIVRVENIDSNKRIYARVLDSNRVKVEF